MVFGVWCCCSYQYIQSQTSCAAEVQPCKMHIARVLVSRRNVARRVFFSPQKYIWPNSRSASSYLTGEPPRGIADDDEARREDLVFAFLPDSVRQELYQLRKSDPSTWTYPKLAEKFNMTINRAKGIIVMMEMREKKMEELGVLNPDPVEAEIYEKHTRNAAESTVEVLMEEYGKTKEEVEDILRRYEDHNIRMTNLNDYNGMSGHSLYVCVLIFVAMMAEEMEDLQDMGLDTKFVDLQQTKMDSSTFVQNYAPELLGDDDFETAKDK